MYVATYILASPEEGRFLNRHAGYSDMQIGVQLSIQGDGVDLEKLVTKYLYKELGV